MSLVSTTAAILRERLPPAQFDRAKWLYQGLFRPKKHALELDYWKTQAKREGGRLKNNHYRRQMLEVSGRKPGFFNGKTVCDFGCGPRGSLAWLKGRAQCFGLDVLADHYVDAFGRNLVEHGMVYVRVTEGLIPLPDAFCDVMFTQNALDHVDDLPVMASEIVRVIKPGGHLFGAFNLYERRTVTEPQSLTPDLLDTVLLNQFEEESRSLVPKADASEALNDGPSPATLRFAGEKRAE
ncbi:MAG: class I SAM-dependent methyltransferase [Pseudomonadota bacterium]